MTRWLSQGLLCVTTLVAAQGSFQAILPAQIRRYRIDFARVFFRSAEAERADRATLRSVLTGLEELKGVVAATPEHLERTLALQNRILVLFNRHYNYLYLRHAVDTRDE